MKKYVKLHFKSKIFSEYYFVFSIASVTSVYFELFQSTLWVQQAVKSCVMRLEDAVTALSLSLPSAGGQGVHDEGTLWSAQCGERGAGRKETSHCEL